MLKDDHGEWIEDSVQLQELVNNFYKNLFTISNQSSIWQHTDIKFPELDSDEIAMLGANITDEEVKIAVYDMSPWKAPGPDGFPAGFYQHSWDTVGMCGGHRVVLLW
jgi:hypothetical protein